MKKIIDARGKACPLPVIEAKKALSNFVAGDTLEVLVDNFIAVQNLSKLAKSENFDYSYEKVEENNFIARFIIDRNAKYESNELDSINCNTARSENIVLVLSSDKMGEGDEKLGHTLMKGFIYALTEQDVLPKTILLYNNGAKLSVEGSDSLADLKLLESQGVEILTCGTCLNYYGLSEKLAVGTVTNMYVIAEKKMKASMIIQP
ncbi:MAG: sulfurtransferase-like selenium metabolism protein YedF [Tissierellia bacterium]|jgi:selenium metabolism protein YedF|nr:sulfurtransferase-like selenium metabolism protein YedF [Tissierellia bacterium]HQC71009.1 sulfurtransferase-like selenium metabolism protein YedF [Sedimentibacter sp.]HQK54705.1 sulfurtransferase-like selenium metabolism protein YedF [Sedimentibacter sp.]HQO73100.1 sulfurtransferase-like selenium metabolism protein YedF [Sedimentibacter sp.]